MSGMARLCLVRLGVVRLILLRKERIINMVEYCLVMCSRV